MSLFNIFFKKKQNSDKEGTTIRFVVNDESEIDQKISALSKQATASKEDNWNGAIDCLKQVKELMIQSDTLYPIETWVRLPVFLQQAGKLDEALIEFEWLLSDVEKRVNKEFGHCALITKKSFIHHRRYIIYDKIRLAFQREKLIEKSNSYKLVAIHEYELYEDFKEKSIKEERQREKASD